MSFLKNVAAVAAGAVLGFAGTAVTTHIMEKSRRKEEEDPNAEMMHENESLEREDSAEYAAHGYEQDGIMDFK